MKTDQYPLTGFLPKRILFPVLAVWCLQLSGQPADTALVPVKTLRIAIHVFQDDAGQGNFRQDSASHADFLDQLIIWANNRLANLDSLKPAFTSPFVSDSRVRIRVDTVYFHRDNQAWNCSRDIDSPYMRDRYVDTDILLDYRQKYQTLPLFIGANNPVVGGHSRNIGDRGYIAVRGYYESFTNKPMPVALDECGRNLIHELCHCMGLLHNFTGGPAGEQCDQCEDNGCPQEGTSNNIMDYWPSYGYALSLCQFRLVHFHLNGGSGNISEVVINDSCYLLPGEGLRISAGETLIISDTVYFHDDLIIEDGGLLRVTGFLSMPGETEISLNPGGRIDIDGGGIGNLCGDLWLGIRLAGLPGDREAVVSVTRGGRIENAETGLNASGPVTAVLENSSFINCPQSLLFKPGSTDSVRLSGCNFRITSKLNHYEEGVVPGIFVRTEGIQWLGIDGCTFANEPGTYVFDSEWMGTGVLSNARRVTVTGSSFLNLTVGIDLLSQDPESKAEVAGNVFTHNKYGVRTSSAGIQWISGNRMTLQRFNRGSTIGVLLMDPDRFVVQQNTFTSVFGSGRMAGIVINHPGMASSAVFDNQFSNLPAGIFMNGLPDIDEALFAWAGSDADLDVPDLGPQFRNNQFDSVNLFLAGVVDSVFGIAIGPTVEAQPEYNIPATDWITGGYSWYSREMPMLAFRGWKTGLPARKGHGFYWFANYPGVTDPNREFAGAAGYRILKDYLNEINRMEQSGDWPTGETVYQALSRIAPYPAAVRSARLSDFWTAYRAEEQTWLRRSLATISERFVAADTLLTDLGTMLARQNRDAWSGYRPPAGSMIPIDSGIVPPEGFDLPDLSAFRFIRPFRKEPDLPSFRLYPNPVQEFLMVSPLEGFSFDKPWEGYIMSSDGKYAEPVRIQSWADQRLLVSSLPAGIYLIELFSGNQYLGAAKFVKTNN
jgi:hypothetical protein